MWAGTGGGRWRNGDRSSLERVRNSGRDCGPDCELPVSASGHSGRQREVWWKRDGGGREVADSVSFAYLLED